MQALVLPHAPLCVNLSVFAESVYCGTRGHKPETLPLGACSLVRAQVGNIEVLQRGVDTMT